MSELSFLGVCYFSEDRGERRDSAAPPMLDAAIPVLAVTEIASGFFACFLRRAEIIARSSNDFPVPAIYVRQQCRATNSRRVSLATTHIYN